MIILEFWLLIPSVFLMHVVRQVPTVILVLLDQSSQILRYSRVSFSKLVKTQIAGPYPQSSDSICLKGGLKICMSNQFPDDTDAAGSWEPNLET